MLFEIQTSQRSGWAVLTVYGELDVASAPGLRQEAVRAISAGARKLVIDLGPTDFLDSTGLGVVVGVLKRIRGLDGELVVVANEARISKVFTISQVDHIVPVVGSVDEAVGAEASRG